MAHAHGKYLEYTGFYRQIGLKAKNNQERDSGSQAGYTILAALHCWYFLIV